MENRKETWMKAAKITGGAILAIVIAALAGLRYSTSAGIITILTIQNTKRETLQTALGRTLAFGCALVLSAICWNWIGFTIPAFGVYLLLFSFLCLAAGWTAAIAMDSVLITHFLTEKAMTPELIVNEVLLFAIGTGIGILLNLHLHPKAALWKSRMDEADETIRGIILRMAERVRSLDRSNYDGSCFQVLQKQLQEARSLAVANIDNSFPASSGRELDYTEMRMAQSLVLKHIYQSIRMLSYLPDQAEKVGKFLEQTGRQYDSGNDGQQLIAQLHTLLKEMKKEPLPKEREEFESRAVLFYILKQLEGLLLLKQEYARKYPVRN